MHCFVGNPEDRLSRDEAQIMVVGGGGGVGL